MPLMDSNKHFRKRLGKRGIAFSWAPSVLAQQNGKGMGHGSTGACTLFGSRQETCFCTLHSHAPLGSAAVPHLDTITITP
jgi:hypothetical protein